MGPSASLSSLKNLPYGDSWQQLISYFLGCVLLVHSLFKGQNLTYLLKITISLVNGQGSDSLTSLSFLLVTLIIVGYCANFFSSPPLWLGSWFHSWPLGKDIWFRPVRLLSGHRFLVTRCECWQSREDRFLCWRPLRYLPLFAIIVCWGIGSEDIFFFFLPGIGMRNHLAQHDIWGSRLVLYFCPTEVKSTFGESAMCIRQIKVNQAFWYKSLSLFNPVWIGFQLLTTEIIFTDNFQSNFFESQWVGWPYNLLFKSGLLTE